MNITITNRQRTKKINTQLLKQIVNGLFAEFGMEDGELGINLVGAKEMTKVNGEFLRHAGSTDVITFDYTTAAPGVMPPTLHGELFVCVTEAILQAKKFGTSWQSEVVRYSVHGVLHLLGHDDLKPYLRRKMKREENRLVRRLTKRFSLAQLSRTVKLGA